MIRVKRGDRYAVTWTANMDLTGSTTKLLARRLDAAVAEELAHEVPAPSTGVLVHRLEGDLEPGDYIVTVEVTPPGGDLITFPTRQREGQPQYEILRVLES